MRFYFNEASVQGQFEDESEFRALIEHLMSARVRSPLLSRMRTTSKLAERPVSHERSVRQVAQGWRGSPTVGILLAWVAGKGMAIEEDRLKEEDDLFYCLSIDVTDGGLGEAARRVKVGEAAATISFPGGVSDFSESPLIVCHGLEDEPIGDYQVENFCDIEVAILRALQEEKPATSWEAMVEEARRRFPKLLLPDALHENPRLAREPFDAVVRDRFLMLLCYLDAYMRGRDDVGNEGQISKEVLRTHFNGDRALFSPESSTNQRNFRSEMTFPDPEGGAAIFAHFHGKISHRVFRLHFEWPVAAHVTKLKILYLGPKITKN